MRKHTILSSGMISTVMLFSLLGGAAMAGKTPGPTPNVTSKTSVKPTPTLDPYGPQQEYKILVEKDRTEGTNKEIAPVGGLYSCDDPDSVLKVGMEVVKFTDSDGTASYSLEMTWDSDGWLFIEDGDSLIMRVDGKKMIFTGPGSLKHREVYDDGSVAEAAFYKVTKAQLHHLANAKDIVVKLVGQSSYSEGCFGDLNHGYLKRAVSDLVDSPKPSVTEVPLGATE